MVDNHQTEESMNNNVTLNGEPIKTLPASIDTDSLEENFEDTVSNCELGVDSEIMIEQQTNAVLEECPTLSEEGFHLMFESEDDALNYA